jgi:hypothetical protein
MLLSSSGAPIFEVNLPSAVPDALQSLISHSSARRVSHEKSTYGGICDSQIKFKCHPNQCFALFHLARPAHICDSQYRRAKPTWRHFINFFHDTNGTLSLTCISPASQPIGGRVHAAMKHSRASVDLTGTCRPGAVKVKQPRYRSHVYSNISWTDSSLRPRNGCVSC